MFWKQHGKKILAWLPRDVGFATIPGSRWPLSPGCGWRTPAFRTGRIAEAASPARRSSASIWTTEIETMCCDLDGQGKAAVIRVGMQFHRFRAS